MYLNRQQFSRGAADGSLSHTGNRQRFRGQYFRSRTSPSRMQDKQDDLSSGPLSHQNQYRSEQQQQQQQSYNNNQRRHQRDSLPQSDIEEIKDLCSKLSSVLELVKMRVDEIANNMEQLRASLQTSVVPSFSLGLSAVVPTDNGNRRRRIKVLNKQRVPLDKNEQAVATTVATATAAATSTSADKVASANNLANDRDNNKKRNPRRRQDFRDGTDKRDSLSTNARQLPSSSMARGDDSTTQAADPSSEDKVEGDDGQGNERVKRVFRRRKQHFNKRRFYNNRRRRNDSSERNSNDTSPQNEINGDDYRSTNAHKSTNRGDNRLSNGRKRSFPELSESEMSEIIQVLKRDFFSTELDAVKKTIDAKGPTVAQEFASSILDHAMCDVTSPTKLSEIASNLYQLIISEQGGLEFQQGFYGALSTIACREHDIIIDAPRYMDTLGQIIGECVVPMNTNRHRQLLRRFLNKTLSSYGQKGRAQLLASIMRGIARHKEDRFAKDIWDVANLKWTNFLPEDANVEQFVEFEDVTFTTRTLSPLPQKFKKTPEELEKFADDVTNLVEIRCTPQTIEDLVRDLELEPDERVEYLGTLAYAIVRGCLTTDAGDYRLDTDALNRYSSILNGKIQLVAPSPVNSATDGGDSTKQAPNKKETFDAIALRALTALTKLWHSYNCPQNLMSTILLALHNHGAASYDALKTWLNSDDLKSVPGIGAARLNSKRFIEDLGASRG